MINETTLLLNNTGTLGTLLQYATIYITGSLTLTFVSILVLFLAVILAFRIPVEIGLILLVPVILMFMAFDSKFLAIGGVALLLLAVYMALKFIIK